jgi:hypothetical protein
MPSCYQISPSKNRIPLDRRIPSYLGQLAYSFNDELSLLLPPVFKLFHLNKSINDKAV